MSESDTELQRATVREIREAIEAIENGEISASECREILHVCNTIRQQQALRHEAERKRFKGAGGEG